MGSAQARLVAGQFDRVKGSPGEVAAAIIVAAKKRARNGKQGEAVTAPQLHLRMIDHADGVTLESWLDLLISLTGVPDSEVEPFMPLVKAGDGGDDDDEDEGDELEAEPAKGKGRGGQSRAAVAKVRAEVPRDWVVFLDPLVDATVERLEKVLEHEASLVEGRDAEVHELAERAA